MSNLFVSCSILQISGKRWRSLRLRPQKDSKWIVCLSVYFAGFSCCKASFALRCSSAPHIKMRSNWSKLVLGGCGWIARGNICIPMVIATIVASVFYIDCQPKVVLSRSSSQSSKIALDINFLQWYCKLQGVLFVGFVLCKTRSNCLVPNIFHLLNHIWFPIINNCYEVIDDTI